MDEYRTSLTALRKESAPWVSQRRTRRFSTILITTITTHLPMRGRALSQTQLDLLLRSQLLSCVAVLSFALPKLEDGTTVRLFQRKKVIYVLSSLRRYHNFGVRVLYRLRFMDYTSTARYGNGRHTWDLPPEMYNGYLTIGDLCMIEVCGEKS